MLQYLFIDGILLSQEPVLIHKSHSEFLNEVCQKQMSFDALFHHTESEMDIM
jgi:hypothetical protein